MDRKLIGVFLLVLASSGCRMCSDCCDYLPPVLDGPYPPSSARAGTIANSPLVPAPDAAEEITDPSLETVSPAAEENLPTAEEAPATE